MSNTGDRESRGASIKPSARASIHSHRFCPFAEAMGRYGIKQNSNKEQRAQTSRLRADRSHDNGTDEVDNIFSKPSQPISTSLTQINNCRSNSLDGIEQQLEKDSNTLSKSLPATFSAHSYCSDDESFEETPVRQEHCYSDSSYNSDSYGTPLTNRSTPVINRRTPGSNRSNLNLSSSISTPNAQNIGSIKVPSAIEGSSKMTLPLLLLAGFLITAVSMFNTTNIPNKVIYDELRFYNDIDKLGNKYGIDENAVLQMQTGIATIFERQDTGSFVFVYNSNANNFNPNKFNMLINDVSNIASKYLRNESKPVHYTLVESSTLNIDDPSELISTFRGDLDRTGVMLVKQVEAIPSTLAMAFHFYCDEYNPLVKKSAIFFTLNLAKCAIETDKKVTYAVIEKCLASKWNGVPADSIGPLLTRVVNVVIDLTRPL